MRNKSLVLGLMVVAAAGCAGDATGPEEIRDARLTAAEAVHVGGQLAESSFTGMGQLSGGWLQGAAEGEITLASLAETITVDHTRECMSGGTARMQGTTSIERTGRFPNRTVVIEATGTETLAACAMPTREVVEGQSEPVTVALTGQTRTEIAFERRSELTEQGFQAAWIGTPTLSRQGTLTYTTSDDREGSCAVNYTVTINPTAATKRIVGEICGYNVDETRPLRGAFFQS